LSDVFHLFERFGVELEYMIVDRGSLDVLPIADKILHAVAGGYESEVEMGALSWSNELALHVIELKTNGPAKSLAGLAAEFHRDVVRINEILDPLGGMLMPTAMHPWMDPHRELRLWPHEYSPVYESFNRIFDCRGHGWANLQSAHINLPFANDEEFGRLHAAIRLVMPLMPAIAASSPIVDGARTGTLDTRLEVYRHNARRIPSISGRIIPEPVFTQRDYETDVLELLYRDIAPHDPEGIVQHEWLNARGAIARFDRNTIEIRVLDVQECPAADLAVVGLIVATLEALVAERWCSWHAQRAWSIDPLASLLLDVIRDGENTVIEDRDYLRAFGLADRDGCTAGELWRHIHGSVADERHLDEREREALGVILEEGSLSSRILRTLGADTSESATRNVFERLGACLREGRMFHA